MAIKSVPIKRCKAADFGKSGLRVQLQLLSSGWALSEDQLGRRYTPRTEKKKNGSNLQKSTHRDRMDTKLYVNGSPRAPPRDERWEHTPPDATDL